MKDQPSLDGYAAVILGSAVNGGRWLPEAAAFVTANGDALGRVPVSLFCVHAMNWFQRRMFRMFGGDVEGDGRDWNAIKAWAEEVPA